MKLPTEMVRGPAVKVARVSLNLRWAVLALAAMLAFAAPAFAQQQPRAVPAQAGGRITAVQIQGNVRAEPETIRSYLQLKEGAAPTIPPPPTAR